MTSYREMSPRKPVIRDTYLPKPGEVDEEENTIIESSLSLWTDEDVNVEVQM